MTQETLSGLAERFGDAQQGRHLTFFIGAEVYGIEIRYVTEIVGMQPITEVPEYPGHIRGIINLRGKIIPVMDIRLRFNMPFKEYGGRTCIIVIHTGETLTGLIVDNVSEVVDIPEENIVSPPDVDKRGQRYLQSIAKTGNEITLLLDCQKLVGGEAF